MFGEIKAAVMSAKGAAIIIVVVAVSVYVWTLHGQIGDLKEEKITVEDELKLEKETVGALKAAQASQQGAIDGLKIKFEDQQKQIKRLKKENQEQIYRLEVANNKALGLERQKKELLLEIAREQIGDSCSDAMNYLKRKSEELGKWPVISPQAQPQP